MTREEHQTQPCPICGKESYRFEFVRIQFVPEDEGWLAKQQIRQGTKLKARTCNTCGAVQLFN